jgi:hypothetical protein
MLLLFVVALLPTIYAQPFAPGIRYSVVYDPSSATWGVIAGQGGVAEGYWEESRYKTGWDELYISTSAAYPNSSQAYALGFLEGALLGKLTWDAWRSGINGTQSNYPEKVKQFLIQNDEWVREQVRLNPTEHYWQQVQLVLDQHEGVKLNSSVLVLVPFLIMTPF